VLTPDSRNDHSSVWIIDGTLIPVHDQPITAPSKNYRRSSNTQIIISADRPQVMAVGRCRPGNRNDVIVARQTLPHLLGDTRLILGDGGYRGIKTIIPPPRDRSGRTIGDHHWRLHRRIPARVEHVIARRKDCNSCVNAVAAATPSTTAFKSCPDTGTSKPTPDYGSSLSG
jgi:hypothetical protein